MSKQRLGLTGLDLKQAMQQPGCPICRIRDETEYRYLYFLLWENVNDGSTRTQMVASLGFCPQHTWQMGRMETHSFGSALGNSILYEDLVNIVHRRLARYLGRVQADRRSRWRRWLDGLLQRPRRWPAPDELTPQAACRVCRMGEGTERAHLRWLLQGLSDPEAEFRKWYVRSERLCLRHLRQAVEGVEPATEAGAMFLARDMLEHLAALRTDLDEYGNKHAWDRRFDKMTKAEKVSWEKALRFFGGLGQSHNGQRPE